MELHFNINIPEFSADKHDWNVKGEFADGTNILGLVLFSVILGVTLGGLKEKGRPLLDVFVALSEAMMVGHYLAFDY